MRFTGSGDVQIFDGRSWQPVESVLDDPEDGDRGEPDGSTGSDDSRRSQ
jgi:hypothetical protein